MHRLKLLQDSSVLRKVWMAVTGALLFGFVLTHMLGNLKAFQGREAFDGYALFLRELGYPVFPESGVLWILRLALLAAVSVHIFAAYKLWKQSRSARSHGYGKSHSQVVSYASRTMRWGGIIILAFVIFHLLHMTTGTAHPDFEYGSVYNNLVIGFQSVPVVAFYLLAVGALSFHLYHGIWSVFTTLGVENRRIDRLRRPLAAVIAWGMFLGYAIVPLAVLTRFLEL
jgi:succinate dehydrogenase / fumarate reductase cytochrome b subunit